MCENKNVDWCLAAKLITGTNTNYCLFIIKISNIKKNICHVKQTYQHVTANLFDLHLIYAYKLNRHVNNLDHKFNHLLLDKTLKILQTSQNQTTAPSFIKKEKWGLF